MKVYISGRITGLEKADMLSKFYKSAQALEKDGHIVMSPAVLSLNEGFDHADYMHICFAMIDVCDAVYLQKDWRFSKGAQMEKEYAEEHQKPLIYEDD